MTPLSSIRTVQNAASAIIPDITVQEIVHSTDKSLVAAGLLGDRGVIIKLLIAEDPYWRRKIANEIDTLVYFSNEPPPVTVADLIAADPHAGVVIVERLPGTNLADQRHPMSAPDPRILAELLASLDRLATWRPNADVFARDGDYMHRFSRYHARGILDADDMRSLAALVARHDKASHVFCHGDVLPANVLTTPAGIALIDWEFAGYLLPGYDAALLWTLYGEHPEARTQIEEHVAAGAIGLECFLVNLAMTVTRELRLMDQFVAGPLTEEIRARLRSDWSEISRRLRK